jgi:hypothetical protein
MAYNISLEATGDPAKNMQDERCSAICKRWSGHAGQEFVARLKTPAPQLEVVSRRHIL